LFGEKLLALIEVTAGTHPNSTIGRCQPQKTNFDGSFTIENATIVVERAIGTTKTSN
jgi:hypothetical protein